jgi:CYTH domain-containing protein
MEIQNQITSLVSHLRSIGYSVFVRDIHNYDNHSSSELIERIITAIDRSKIVLICLTEAYQRCINNQPENIIGIKENDFCRMEFNYCIGCLSSTKMIPLVFDEMMSKKTAWKLKIRSELYSIKPVVVTGVKDSSVIFNEIDKRCDTLLSMKK